MKRSIMKIFTNIILILIVKVIFTFYSVNILFHSYWCYYWRDNCFCCFNIGHHYFNMSDENKVRLLNNKIDTDIMLE